MDKSDIYFLIGSAWTTFWAFGPQMKAALTERLNRHKRDDDKPQGNPPDGSKE